jgi:S1-C subfamily serine protease
VTRRGLAAGALGLGLVACAAVPPTPRGEIIQRLLPSTVKVAAERRGVGVRAASGVAIHAAAAPDHSLVLTTRHPLRGLDDAELYVTPRRGLRRRASVVATSTEADLALLRVDGVRLEPARLGDDGRLGDDVWVVAYPWGRRLTLTGGVVSQVEPSADGDGAEGPALMIDASVSYGASGAGVFEAAGGRLIGLVEGHRTARMHPQDEPKLSLDFPVPGETAVVPVRAIRRFLEQAGYAALLGS